MQVHNTVTTPNFRSIYFVKYKPVFNKKLTYTQSVKNECMQTTKAGIKYIEDINISNDLKNAIKNIPCLKKLSEKFETFIQYDEKPTNTTKKGYSSKINIYHKEKEYSQTKINTIEGFDNNSYAKARENCINNLENLNLLD